MSQFIRAYFNIEEFLMKPVFRFVFPFSCLILLLLAPSTITAQHDVGGGSTSGAAVDSGSRTSGPARRSTRSSAPARRRTIPVRRGNTAEPYVAQGDAA